MEISFGSVITCVFMSVILTVYLCVVIQFKNPISMKGIKWIFAGIIIILVRLLIPFNFPFTISIPIEVIFPEVTVALSQRISEYSIFNILLLIWGIGAVIALSIMVVREIYFHKILKQISSLNGMKTQVLNTIFTRPPFNKLKIVVVSSKVSPSITGIFNPTLILPEYIFSLSEKNQSYIIMHECEHYRKRDIWIKYLIKILTCLYWWNPIIYYLGKKLDLTMELSTDYLVISKMDRRKKIEYTECLLAVGKICQATENVKLFEQFSIPLLHKRSDLDIRVCKIIDSIKAAEHKNPFYPIVNIAAVFLMVCMCLIIVPEARKLPEDVERNTFSMPSENAYLIKQSDGYDVYLNDKYITTVPEVSESLKDLKIYEDEHEK